MEVVDWNSLWIVETHDEEGLIELMSENQMYEILGLREEETNVVPTKAFDCPMDENYVNVADLPISEIPVSDVVPNEVVISYDKNNPQMSVGIVYPSMEEFKMVVRQFAINKEFELGTEKSDTKRYRCYCKSSEDCSWRINGSKLKGQSIVEVNTLI
jgi:hypothetical protein